MAGINFLLDKYLAKPPLSGRILKEAADSFEAIGPWFLTIFCLIVMGIAVYWITAVHPILFYLLITYATAISLILASPFHTIFTRHLADIIFLGRIEAIINGLLALSLIVFLLNLTVSALLVFFVSNVAIKLKIDFVSLTTLLSLLWCITSVLSSLKKERLLLYLFVGGIGTTLALFIGFRPVDPHILLILFSIGVAIPVVGGYSYIIKLYLRTRIVVEADFLQRTEAAKIGLSLFTFNLGFWIDKFIFWFSASTQQGDDPLFHYASGYDFPFFAAVTIMMIGVMMVYKGIKKKITGPYEAFIFKLSNNFSFGELAIEKIKLVHGIGEVSTSIFVFYGGLSLLALFLVYLGAISPPWKNPFIFHYLLIATVFFALYFFYLLVLQYLDDYTALLRLNLLFLCLNAAGTLASIYAGWTYHGTGFMAASMIAALIGFVMVNARVGGLEFLVFRKALRREQLTQKRRLKRREQS